MCIGFHYYFVGFKQPVLNWTGADNILRHLHCFLLLLIPYGNFGEIESGVLIKLKRVLNSF